MIKRRKTRGEIRRRTASIQTQRGRQDLPERTPVLIVTDGKTEHSYFYELRKDAPGFAITVKHFEGKDPEKVINDAVDFCNRSKDEFDHKCCVVDVEGPSSGGRRRSLETAGESAERDGIKIFLSNPSFEVWFLAHFKKTAKQFRDADAVIEQLKKHWQKEFKQDYDKVSDDVYDRLSGHTETAVANAKWVREEHHKGRPDTVDCNSSTDVYKLVEQLLSGE